MLKLRLKSWLTRTGISRYVLGFASAMRHDGGVGAVSILLRKRKKGKERPQLLNE